MGIVCMMPIIAFAQAPDSLATLRADSMDMVDSVDTTQLPPMAIDYTWLTYRGKADISDTGGTRTCNFYMVNRKDSILYLNLHAAGIEFVRIVFTPDSITYVNKLTYQYYKGSYAPFRLLTKLPLDFYAIQSAFNGQTEAIEESLREKRIALEYTDFVALDSAKSFFTQMTFKDLNHLLEIKATSKVIRFDVPGPTSIRIPDKFEALKL
ncbi:MAG: DUF4292 domain-containing protein [Bacteroidales bacterium]|nr:DUF4292 domain-containing protein [Bacteroidales bacterium]